MIFLRDFGLHRTFFPMKNKNKIESVRTKEIVFARTRSALKSIAAERLITADT